MTAWLGKVVGFVIGNKRKVIFNLVYLVGALVSVLVFTYPHAASVPMLNDYSEFYFGSRLLFSPDFSRLYESSGNWFWFSATFHTPVFRSFPSALVFYVPLGMLPSLAVSYTVYVITSYILNILTVFMCVEIARMLKGAVDEKMRNHMLFVYFVMPIHYSNFNQGQVGSVIAFLLVGSMFLYLKNHEFVANLALGVALAIKPTSYFIVIFMLLFSGSLKKLITRGAVILMPICINAIIFLIVPVMLGGFINAAFIHDFNQGVPLPSVTLTSLVTMLAGIFNPMNGQLVIFTIISVPSTLVAMHVARRRNDGNKIAAAFVLGTLLYFTCQYDVWPSQTLYMYPFIIIFQLAYTKGMNGNLKVFLLSATVYCAYDFVRFFKVAFLPGNDASLGAFYGFAVLAAAFTTYFFFSALKGFHLDAGENAVQGNGRDMVV
ncbi:MAG: DUF2029 domain-containing protein [Candidatus Lokiarchaeota archaeon]|nr:DUF2029 domain-containing protein [Candidatus Lokiarchaeota archaeon]